MKHLLIALGAAAALAGGGCQPGITPADLAPQVVVQGYLYANQPIDSIVLSRTMPIDAFYSDSAARISGALVQLTVDGHTFTLLENPASPGAYTLPADSLIVRSEKRYDLTVHALGTTVTASTVVPDTFSITTALPDTVQYPANTLSFGPTIAWTDSPNRIAYAISMEALDTLIYAINGVDTIWNMRVGQTGTDARPLRPRQVTSFLLQLKAPTAPLLWDLFHWYGRHRMTVFAMDTNFVDFMQMQSIGGRQYYPQLNHIVNGLGVFGSAARDEQAIFLKM